REQFRHGTPLPLEFARRAPRHLDGDIKRSGMRPDPLLDQSPAVDARSVLECAAAAALSITPPRNQRRDRTDVFATQIRPVPMEHLARRRTLLRQRSRPNPASRDHCPSRSTLPRTLSGCLSSQKMGQTPALRFVQARDMARGAPARHPGQADSCATRPNLDDRTEAITGIFPDAGSTPPWCVWRVG